MVYNMMFYIRIHCRMARSSQLRITSLSIFLYVVRTLKIYSQQFPNTQYVTNSNHRDIMTCIIELLKLFLMCNWNFVGFGQQFLNASNHPPFLFQIIYLFVCLFICLLRWSLTLSPRLKCMAPSWITATSPSLGSSNSPASTSWVVGTTGAYHHTCLNFLFCFVIRRGFTMLVRLVLNSQPQVIHLPWPPKCLDYRREPPCPDIYFFFF